MLVYWTMFLLTAGYALSARRHTHTLVHGMRSARVNMAWVTVGVLLTLLIGYRYQVGGDWGNYLRHLHHARYQDFTSAIEFEDPAYSLLNLLAVRLGWGMAGVNVVCGLLFSMGLVVFCRGLPRPWLALAVAIPYLVTVVAMGYTRQSVALGLAMLGLVALTRREIRWFVFWVLFASTFHKSAVLLLPIAALASTRNKYWIALWMAIVSLGAYFVFLDRSVDTLYANYVEAQYQSQGAIIRTAMNFVPACFYLCYRRRFSLPPIEANLWRWFSIFSIVLFLAASLLPATTAVDRIALYMLPLQLVIFAHLPDALGRMDKPNTGFTFMILFYYGCVLFVWLNFATNARYWIPYRFYPLEVWF
ncbi:MAG: EpsG family protein [Halioglobus sp.]